jgi:hypothetical protein
MNETPKSPISVLTRWVEAIDALEHFKGKTPDAEWQALWDEAYAAKRAAFKMVKGETS